MARYELKKGKGKTWYIESPVNIGVFEGEKGIILIDSGNDKEAGREIRKVLDRKGWALSLIINTHSNGDHIGGNAYFNHITGCSVAVPCLEAEYTKKPILEPAFLWGGYPFKKIRNKFLMAKASEVDFIIENTGPIMDTPLEAFPLPGHFMNMIGIRTPDDVVFLADTLFGEDILSKYRMVFLYDIEGYLRTLDMLSGLEADLYVPSHASPREDIQTLIEANRRNTLDVAETIIRESREPVDTEELLKNVCDRFGIQLDYNQYVLLMSTLKSYLTYLNDRGNMVPEIRENRLLWQAAE